jgi:hypothetical protein
MAVPGAFGSTPSLVPIAVPIPGAQIPQQPSSGGPLAGLPTFGLDLNPQDWYQNIVNALPGGSDPTAPSMFDEHPANAQPPTFTLPSDQDTTRWGN